MALQRHSLITGGSGFIGSHLAEALLAAGDRVTVVDNQSTGSRQNLAAIEQAAGFRFVPGDITDAGLMAELVGQADRVFHLAAAVGVQLVANDPVRTIETNIAPTEHLLRLLRERQAAGRPCPLFLASSSEVYGKNPETPWSEEADLVFGPTSRLRWSYGASKAIDEFLALASHRQLGVPIVIGRFFNVVGPRQVGNYGMVLPRLAQAALRDEPMTIHDDGRQVRCFAHVADVVEAITRLMDTPSAAGQIFNIGSDQPISILELAHLVASTAGVPPRLQFQTYGQAYGSDFEDVRHRVPDLTRLRQTIDFRPRYDLTATVAAVIDYQRQQLTKA